MADNLDRWIKDSKAQTPDSGEFRRLNRILIKDRIAAVGPSRRRRFRSLSVILALVLLLLMSGQVSQLGSDDFDIRTSTAYRPLLRDSVLVHENVFRGGTTSFPSDYSAADVDEFQRSLAAGEGTVTKAIGLSYGGKTSWIKLVTRDINGKVNTVGLAVENPASQEPENYLEFLRDHYRDLIARTRTDPPHGVRQLTLDGLQFRVESWTYEYPGYGKVTRYLGVPLS